MGSTLVKSCTCSHSDQDSLYGKGMRLMNHTTGANRPEWRCTVCGTKSTRFARGGGFYPAK